MDMVVLEQTLLDDDDIHASYLFDSLVARVKISASWSKWKYFIQNSLIFDLASILWNIQITIRTNWSLNNVYWQHDCHETVGSDLMSKEFDHLLWRWLLVRWKVIHSHYTNAISNLDGITMNTMKTYSQHIHTLLHYLVWIFETCLSEYTWSWIVVH